MLSYSDALEKLLAAVPDPVEESVPIDNSLRRCLAEDIPAETDLPPFDKSLVDGFALRSTDLERGWFRLTIIGESAAGNPCPYRVGPAEAVRIMTGAVLPEGADAVQMIEKTEVLSPREVVIKEGVNAGEHILRQGAEIRKGGLLVEQGSYLGPAGVGLLAAAGRSSVRVRRLPKAVAASTGDELVPAGEPIGPGQIRDSNGPMLEALLQSAGLECPRAAKLPDDPAEVSRFLASHNEADLVLISGGVSMGEKDFVHRVIKEEAGEILFHKAAVKPGKPFLAAKLGRRLILGLPGNPVSTFVSFHVFVLPVIRKLQGFRQCRPRTVRLLLTESVRQRPGRLFFMPGRLIPGDDGLRVRPVQTRGSSDLANFSSAEVLMAVPADCAQLDPGEPVDVLFLDQGGLWR